MSVTSWPRASFETTSLMAHIVTGVDACAECFAPTCDPRVGVYPNQDDINCVP